LESPELRRTPRRKRFWLHAGQGFGDWELQVGLTRASTLPYLLALPSSDGWTGTLRRALPTFSAYGSPPGPSSASRQNYPSSLQHLCSLTQGNSPPAAREEVRMCRRG